MLRTPASWAWRCGLGRLSFLYLSYISLSSVLIYVYLTRRAFQRWLKLSVVFDQKVKWRAHVQRAVKRAISWKRGIPHLYTEAPEGKISVSYGEEGSAWEGPFTLAKGRADVTKGTSLCCCTWDQSNIRMFCQDRNNALTVWAWKERQDWILDGYV
jgi:hypothetical protein